MLKKAASRFVLTGASVALLCGVTAAPAWAKATTNTAGIDVSHVQCSSSDPSALAQPLPTGEAFAIVGVNGGLANNYNTCLGAEFTYAQGLTSTTAQKPAQTYLNTADPGNTVADWPSPAQPGAYGNTSTPTDGTCNYATTGAASGPGADSPACAYVYGYDMVAGMTSAGITGDLAGFSNATSGHALYAQPVWLDVETTNSWQTDVSMNVADLQGMVDALDHAASSGGATAQVGVYSTSSQWGQITGTPTGGAAGNLAALPVWIPGARSEKGAAANCTQAAFTSASAKVLITQWFGQPYDGDHSCIN